MAPVIREDGHTLYGFLTVDEKNLFHNLTAISGIGPKTAVAILGHVDVTDFQLAVLQANSPLLSKIPGVGKKTAERLIIELKDKFQNIPRSDTNPSVKGGSVVADTISALANLGYHPLEVQKTIKKILHEQAKEPSLSELITLALRSL